MPDARNTRPAPETRLLSHFAMAASGTLLISRLVPHANYLTGTSRIPSNQMLIHKLPTPSHPTLTSQA